MDRSIVDEYIEASGRGLEHAFDHTGTLRSITEIGNDGEGRATAVDDLLNDPLTTGSVAIEHGDTGTLAGKTVRDTSPDAAPGASDQHHGVLEAVVGR